MGTVGNSHLYSKMAKYSETGQVSQFHLPLPIMAKDAANAGADVHTSAERTTYINQVFNDKDFLYEQYSHATAVNRAKIGVELRQLLDPVMPAVKLRRVLPVAPMLQRAMERPASWMRIDGRGGSDHVLLWRKPERIRTGKLMKEVVVLVLLLILFY